jgi:hypothetical protein
MVLVIRKHAGLGASYQTDPPECWSLAKEDALHPVPILFS